MTEMWERFSFYGIKAILLPYMVAKLAEGGLGWENSKAGPIFGLFAGSAYLVGLAGGWIADKYGAYKVTWRVMWVCWVCFFLLSYPPTSMAVKTVSGNLSLHIALGPWLFTGLLFVVGVAMAIGKASVFKFIGDDFTDNIGAVSGVVGLAGGLGGFVLPILFGALVDLTGVRSSAFMLMYGAVSVSLVWMHYAFKPARSSLDSTAIETHPGALLRAPV